MEPTVVQALRVLGFSDPSIIPSVREINCRFRKLAFLKHPDRNNGSPESTSEFQELLNAYNTAGSAAEATAQDPDDNGELVARKMFRQFQSKSVKENSSSVTILTEKFLYSIWMEILTTFSGIPENKGPHGNKFTVQHTFDEVQVKVYLTMYKTGKLLVQAEKNKQNINLHFLNMHLEYLFSQVYNQQSNQKTLQTQNKLKTPLTKPIKTIGRISVTISKCHECQYKTTDTAKLRKHMKKEHGIKNKKANFTFPETLDLVPETAETAALPSSTGSELTTHHCLFCDHVFTNQTLLSKHLSEHHQHQSDTLQPDSRKSRKFEISTPFTVLPLTPTTLSSFKCFLCPNSYYNEGEWKNHE